MPLFTNKESVSLIQGSLLQNELYHESISPILSITPQDTQKIVRELFLNCSRTILILFANNFLPVLEVRLLGAIIKSYWRKIIKVRLELSTSTKCTFVEHGLYFRAPRVVQPYPISPTTRIRILNTHV